MPSDEEISESGIDTALRAFAPMLNAEPSAAVVERARSAMQHALNEAWLAGQPQPAPRKLDRVRDRINCELVSIARERRLRIASGLAAAAGLGICVGVIRLAGMLATGGDAANPEIVDAFVRAGRDLRRDRVVTWTLEAGIDSIEEGLGDWDNDPLGELDEELKRLEREAGTL